MQWLQTIIAIVERIFATFWGVVIGSFFTIVGITLTNRAHDKRLDRQLKHDQQLKQREQGLSLRKEIYLDAAEAVSIGVQTLARFGDLSIPSEKVMANFVERSAAIAKAHIVASPDIARAVASFNSALTIASPIS